MIASLEPLMIDGEALARRRRKDPDTVRPCATRENAGARFLPLRAYLLAQCFILEELCHALRRLVHGSDWKTANAVFDLLLQTPARHKTSNSRAAPACRAKAALCAQCAPQRHVR